MTIPEPTRFTDSTKDTPLDQGYQMLDRQEPVESPALLELAFDPSLEMPQQDIDLIKSTMASLDIPAPDWAKVIPEESWLPVFKKE